MDSLLATYASSDDEQEEQQQQQQQQQLPLQNSSNPKSSSPFLSLPPPKSQSNSSPFLSLPPPKSQSSSSSVTPHKFVQDEEEEDKPSSSSSLFSILPPPKTDPSALPNNPLSASDPKPKRVVQFRPPVNPFSAKSDDEDEDEDEGEKERKRKRAESFTPTPSVKSFLSSIPAPKNSTTLGVLGSGSGRRSTIEADVPVPDMSNEVQVQVPVESNTGYNENQRVDGSLGVASDYSDWGAQGFVNHEEYAGYTNDGTSDYSHVDGSNANYADYGGNYGTYTGYEHYGSDGAGGSSATAASAIMETAEVALRLPGKRGRKDAPDKIVEVRQDDLMKNRPREDQTRATGIAFGPSYQPVSSKGKPSKLLKRKHQISTLYFDMKQKEMELAERRAKGMLTKAQTQGKYGW